MDEALKSNLKSLVMGFELMSEGFINCRPTSFAEVSPLADVRWRGSSVLDATSDLVDVNTVRFLFKYLCSRYLDDPRWLVIPVVPGLPIATNPASALLAGVLESQPDVRADALQASQWAVLIVDLDGRRPGTVQVRLAGNAVDPFYWRSCVAERATFWHSIAGSDQIPARRLQALDAAEEGLAKGAVDAVRGLVAVEPITIEILASRSVFGSLWDLLATISVEQGDPVSPGAWRLPDRAAHELRCRAHVYEDAARLYFCPATFDIQAFRLHVYQWLAARLDARGRQRILDNLEALALAFASWKLSVTKGLVSTLRNLGIVLETRDRVNGGHPILAHTLWGRSSETARRVHTWLRSVGLGDWSVQLEAGERDDQVCDETQIIRRLRGLRSVSGLSVDACAQTVGIPPSKAKYLLYKKYRAPHAHKARLLRELRTNALLPDNLNGTDALTWVRQSLNSGQLGPEIFDTIRSLLPTRYSGRRGPRVTSHG